MYSSTVERDLKVNNKKKKTCKEIQMRKEKKKRWIDTTVEINSVLSPKCSHLYMSQSNGIQISFKHLLNRWIEWEEHSRSLAFNLLRNEYSFADTNTHTRYTSSFHFNSFLLLISIILWTYISILYDFIFSIVLNILFIICYAYKIFNLNMYILYTINIKLATNAHISRNSQYPNVNEHYYAFTRLFRFILTSILFSVCISISIDSNISLLFCFFIFCFIFSFECARRVTQSVWANAKITRWKIDCCRCVCVTEKKTKNKT